MGARKAVIECGTTEVPQYYGHVTQRKQKQLSLKTMHTEKCPKKAMSQGLCTPGFTKDAGKHSTKDIQTRSTFPTLMQSLKIPSQFQFKFVQSSSKPVPVKPFVSSPRKSPKHTPCQPVKTHSFTS